MCGFAGFVGSGSEHNLRAMTSQLAHRGPDDEAFHSDPAFPVHLGFRRLVVLDPAGGAQPMVSSDSNLVVTFNGEIYNHSELRRELEDIGRSFRSDHSDTEVLLHGYAIWGDALPEKLDGMFAFVIWDRCRRRIFCARDRFGEKPFYYADMSGQFAFASEITALHAHPEIQAQLDPAGVQKFFAYGYVPAPGTIYRHIRKLPPGSLLSHDLDSGETRVARYWRFVIEAEEHAPYARIPALAEELRALLLQAVERRLGADVPLGVFLSGGIDSTGMLAMAAQARRGQPVDTFTIGFDDPSYDESRFARAAAEAIGSRHNERIIDLGIARQELDGLLYGLDEPFADPSILPTHLLARFARESVTVALSGDGGDELFAGYDPFLALMPAAIYDRVMPEPVHRLLQAAAARIPRQHGNMSFDFRLRRTLRGLSYRPALWNPVWLGPLAPDAFAACFENPLTLEELFAEAIDAWDQSPSRNAVDRTLEFYTNFYLPEMILTKADRATMRASLESRAPFLDRDVAAFCQRLPHGYKLRGGQRKFLLREALRGLIPDFVLDRKKKGFGIPLTRWLAAFDSPGPLPGSAGMRPDFVAARWEGLRGNTEDERLFLWAHLCLTHAAAAA